MPIAALMGYIVLTFCPVIYKVMPFLGTVKIVLVAGIVLLITFIATYGNYTNATAYRHTIVSCWAVVLAAMTLGILVSVDRGLTFQAVQSSLKSFLIFLIMIKIVDSTERLRTVLVAFVLSGVGMAGSTLYSYFIDPHVLNAASAEGLSGGYRAIALDSGLFADPNDLALLLNAVLPFAMYVLLTMKHKVLSVIGLGALVVAIMLTHSRAGFLGMCVTMAGFALLFRKEHGKYIIILCLLALSMFAVVPGSYKERIVTIFSSETGKGEKSGRIDGWLIAVKEGLARPVLGVGAYGSVYVEGKTSGDWHAVHNSFAQVFVEIGMFGFAAYTGLFITSMKQSRDVTGADNTKLFSKTLGIAFMAYSTCAFFTPQGYSPLLFILTAFTVISSELMKKGSFHSPQPVMQAVEGWRRYQVNPRPLPSGKTPVSLGPVRGQS